MITKMLSFMKKSVNMPDETRSFPHGQVELVEVEGNTFGRMTLQPGWRWSNDVKPTVKTDSCQTGHYQYVISGRLMCKMDDGSMFEIKAGDAVVIPPGHDAWVLGDEPFVAIDFMGMKEYASSPHHWRFWRRGR